MVSMAIHHLRTEEREGGREVVRERDSGGDSNVCVLLRLEITLPTIVGLITQFSFNLKI